MVLLTTDRPGGELADQKRLFEATGHRTYTLATSRGSVFTVMGSHASEFDGIPGLTGQYCMVTPDVPYVLASRKIKDTSTVIRLPNGASIGGNELAIIAGPCSVETRAQMMDAARCVRESGASILRGGAFKPRTSPYAFQGLGIEGLRLIRDAADAHGLAVITEVMDADDLPAILDCADILQVGARNCQNFALLKKLGRCGKPVLLKRGMMTTIGELLMSAEYILSEGNMDVILCERGIRTFETETRNTLDISAIPVLRAKTHLPIVVDPSHAAGNWKLIEPLAMAALAAGADGLVVEVHPDPAHALCDGNQSLRPDKFAAMMERIRPLAGILNRGLSF
jgi:3-deoxy-7-phosphoheptulonate synthase